MQHMMEEVVIGTRTMERFESTYTEVYQFMMAEVRLSISCMSYWSQHVHVHA